MEGKTPHEVLYGKRPDYNSLKSFGCLCFSSTLERERTKFDQRAYKCIFVGYPFETKGYKVLNLETGEILVSRNVVFHEDTFPCRKKTLEIFDIQNFPTMTDVFSGCQEKDLNYRGEEYVDPDKTEIFQLNEEVIPGMEIEVPGDRRATRQRRQLSYLINYHCGLLR